MQRYNWSFDIIVIEAAVLCVSNIGSNFGFLPLYFCCAVVFCTHLILAMVLSRVSHHPSRETD